MLKIKLWPILTIFLTFIYSGEALARIDILPNIAFIDSTERSTELTILNMSDKATAFKIEITSTKQDAHGKYEILDKPLSEHFDPEEHVRFSPRQFTLPARGRQKIRLSLRKPSDLPDGDYRFHVRAAEYSPKDVPVAAPDKEGQSISIGINLSVSIPIIVRHGKAKTQVEMKNFSLTPASETISGKPQLRFDIERYGSASLLGEVALYWTPEGGNKERIGYISNMNVFSETPVRHVELNLKEMPSGTGSLVAVLKDSISDQVYHEATLK